MWPYSEWAIPVSSFLVPVTPPLDDPDKCPRVCIEFSREWLPYVLGALTQLLLQTTWIGTKEEISLTQKRAHMLIGMIAEQGYNDMNCCDCPTTLYRFTADGMLEQSTDDGLTWTPAPGADPRITGTMFPPLSGADGDTKKCMAAANMVLTFIDYFDQYADELEAQMGLADLITTVAVTLAPFLGEISAIIAFASIFASRALQYGAEAMRAAFTNAVWDRLRCNLFCHIADDGTVSAAAVAAIKSQIDEDETGIANVLLKTYIDTLGQRGLTNMGRSGGSDGDECGDCGCDCTTEQAYLADSDDFSGGTVGNNGSFSGRFVGAGETLTLEIPDRAGRIVSGVYIAWTGIAGASGSYTLSVGGQASEESPVARTGSESPINTLTPSVDDSTVTFALSGAVSYHVHSFTIFYDC